MTRVIDVDKQAGRAYSIKTARKNVESKCAAPPPNHLRRRRRRRRYAARILVVPSHDPRATRGSLSAA